MMRLTKVSLAAAAVMTGAIVSAGSASARVEAGMLTCEVEEGFALIISKPRDLHCVFHKSNGQSEAYKGKLREFGLDIGVSGRGVIAWAVLAQTTELPPGELAGSYGGLEAGAAAVVGGRGQVMVGGARRTISLQPLSVEGEIGVNIAVGITSMELHPLFRGRISTQHNIQAPAVGHSYETVPHERQHVHYGCGSYTHLQRGQTLYGLAHACGVTVEALLEANPRIKNVREIPDGALVHIPSHVGHHAKSPCGDKAYMEQGESLDQVAWRCGVTLHALLRENPDVRDLEALKPGLVLAIPARSAPAREAPVRWARNETGTMTDASPRDSDQPTDQAGRAAKKACLERVAKETGEPDVTVLSSEFSQANSVVMVGVGRYRAPWRCLVSNDGIVAEVGFMGRDGDGVDTRTAGVPGGVNSSEDVRDAKVPGTEFHATGIMSCARSAGQPMGNCNFGVVRERGGNGRITVFWPDGGNRVIYYEDLTPMSYDESQADGGAKMTVSQKSGLFFVKIGEQRFEFPEAVMTGG